MCITDFEKHKHINRTKVVLNCDKSIFEISLLKSVNLPPRLHGEIGEVLGP